jgi:hypothetical protein
VSASTFAALVRDPDTGRMRGIRLVVDGDRVRLELGATTGNGRATADISEMRAAVVAALKEEDEG